MDAARNRGQENELATDKVNYGMKLFSAVAIVAVCAGHISSVGLSGPFNMVLPYSYKLPRSFSFQDIFSRITRLRILGATWCERQGA